VGDIRDSLSGRSPLQAARVSRPRCVP
jgi:hypothetical protein